MGHFPLRWPIGVLCMQHALPKGSTVMTASYSDLLRSDAQVIMGIARNGTHNTLRAWLIALLMLLVVSASFQILFCLLAQPSYRHVDRQTFEALWGGERWGVNGRCTELLLVLTLYLRCVDFAGELNRLLRLFSLIWLTWVWSPHCFRYPIHSEMWVIQ